MRFAASLAFVLTLLVSVLGSQVVNPGAPDAGGVYATGVLRADQPHLTDARSWHKPGCKRGLNGPTRTACGSAVALSVHDPLSWLDMVELPGVAPLANVPKPFRPTGPLDPPRSA